MNQIGNNLKKLRKAKNLTQEQLSEQMNVTHQAISNWENGKTQPDIETLTRLAEFFGVSVEEIIYGEKKSSIQTVTEKGGKAGVSFGAALAMVISYAHWQSIGWAIFHGLLGWVYVIYYVIKY